MITGVSGSTDSSIRNIREKTSERRRLRSDVFLLRNNVEIQRSYGHYKHKQIYPTEYIMNQKEQVLLLAIQKSLWNTDVTFPEDADWKAVLGEAVQQTVLGIVEGVAPEEYRNEWKSVSSFNTAHFLRVLHYQSELCNLMKAHTIPMAILKGTAAAIYYPTPLQRTAGDIDFLVAGEYIESAKDLLAENGYEIKDDPRYPRHVEVCKDGISFEMHRFFTDNDGVDVDRFLFDGLHRTEQGQIYNTAFPMLPPVENGLVLLAHIAHHLREGLGLRQMIDWMMYVDRKLDDEAWENGFRAAAEKTGLDMLARVATRMCQMYLGLSERFTWCRTAEDDLCNSLLNNLLSSGNFGRKRGEGLKVESTVSHLKRKGFRHLQQAGEHNWEAYHRHKWLKPFAWIYQIGRYAKQGVQTKRKGNQIKEDIARGKQRSELYQKLKIGKPKE